jgi:hypothetical protein
MASAVLQQAQFGRKKIKRDPLSDKRKTSFGGASGPKTMQVDRGKGLPAPQSKHLHRKHAAARSHRAK